MRSQRHSPWRPRREPTGQKRSVSVSERSQIQTLLRPSRAGGASTSAGGRGRRASESRQWAGAPRQAGGSVGQLRARTRPRSGSCRSSPQSRHRTPRNRPPRTGRRALPARDRRESRLRRGPREPRRRASGIGANRGGRRELPARPRDQACSSVCAWHNLANALAGLGRIDDALVAYRRALALAPNSAELHNNLGSLLRGCGHLEEAVACFSRSIDLAPDFAEAHANMGLAQRLQSRPHEARASCLRALELKPDFAPALTTLAESHADTGDFAGAERLFRRAVAVDRDSPEAWAGMSRLRRMTLSDSHWLAEAQRIAALPLPARKESHLRYAMGKYFDDVGQFELAFAEFEQANELTKRTRPAHDPQPMTRAVNRIIDFEDREGLARVRRVPKGSERAVFIVGMLRSGTTLAEQILASHPQIVGAGELPFWNAAADAVRSAPDEPTRKLRLEKPCRGVLGDAGIAGLPALVESWTKCRPISYRLDSFTRRCRTPASFICGDILSIPASRSISSTSRPHCRIRTTSGIWRATSATTSDHGTLAFGTSAGGRSGGALRSARGRSGRWSRRMIEHVGSAVGSSLSRASPDPAHRDHREQVAGATADHHGRRRALAKLPSARGAAARFAAARFSLGPRAKVQGLRSGRYLLRNPPRGHRLLDRQIHRRRREREHDVGIPHPLIGTELRHRHAAQPRAEKPADLMG